MASLPSNSPYFITLSEWSDLQNIKKARKIMEIETLLVIQNCKENTIFNSTIKKLVRINIFDLSRISYLVILFLSPYIDPHLKELLNYDEDVPTSIIERIYDTENHDYLPPLDKTITNILSLVLNQLITMELFLNIHVFILYLNLYIHYKSPQNPSVKNNLFIFKISQLLETITTLIPNSTLSLLIMKIINKLSKLYTNSFSDEVLRHLGMEMEMEDPDTNSRISEIMKNTKNNNELLDKFILNVMELCDASGSSDIEIDKHFILIWNTCKNHMINMMQNCLQVFKISLDILISHLVKEQPALKPNSSCISNSIINFLEMEIHLLDTKLHM